MTSLEDINFTQDGLSGLTYDDPTPRRSPLSDIDMYVRYGTYNGIKVEDNCRDRMIPKDTDLSQVFDQKNDISVYCLDIFPGSNDINKYQELLQSVYTGDSIIESIDKHPTDKGFVVMLVVNNARMRFRISEYNNIFPSIGVTNE